MHDVVKAPFWRLDGKCEQAFGLEGLLYDWDAFVAWVKGLPERYVQLKAFAQTGRTTNRTALGHELLDAWEKHPGQRHPVGTAVDSLADGIVWRVVRWARANDYQPPHDPGELVLFDPS